MLEHLIAFKGSSPEELELIDTFVHGASDPGARSGSVQP
jgi:hypothetical protein